MWSYVFFSTWTYFLREREENTCTKWMLICETVVLKPTLSEDHPQNFQCKLPHIMWVVQIVNQITTLTLNSKTFVLVRALIMFWCTVTLQLTVIGWHWWNKHLPAWPTSLSPLGFFVCGNWKNSLMPITDLVNLWFKNDLLFYHLFFFYLCVAIEKRSLLFTDLVNLWL